MLEWFVETVPIFNCVGADLLKDSLSNEQTTYPQRPVNGQGCNRLNQLALRKSQGKQAIATLMAM